MIVTAFTKSPNSSYTAGTVLVGTISNSSGINIILAPSFFQMICLLLTVFSSSALEITGGNISLSLGRSVFCSD